MTPSDKEGMYDDDPNRTERWDASKRAAVVLQILSDEITLTNAARRYNIKARDFVAWIDAYIRVGKIGLQSKALEELVDNLEPASSTVEDRRMISVSHAPRAANIFANIYEQLDEQTRALTHTLACFAAEPIPRALVEALGWPEPELEHGLCLLRSHHLLTNECSKRGSVGQLHEMLAEHIKSSKQDKRSRSDLTRARDALVVAWEQQRGLDSRGPDLLIPHAEAWCESLHRVVSLRQITAIEGDLFLWLEVGLYWYNNTAFERASLHQRRTRAFARQHWGEHRPDTLTATSNLALTLRAMGDPQHASNDLAEVLVARRNVLGELHPQTLASMRDFAETLKMIGHREHALPYQESALAGYQEVFGEHHPHTLASMQEVAETLQEAHCYDRALDHHTESLKRHIHTFGECHVETLTAMNLAADSLRCTGDFERAISHHEETVEACLRVFGRRHPHTVSSMNSFAITLFECGAYERSLMYQSEVLRARQHMLGEHHRHTLSSMSNVARVLKMLGRYEHALSYHERSLERSREVFGEAHTRTIRSMNNVAETLNMLGRHEQELEYRESVLEHHRRELMRYRKVEGEHHPRTLSSMSKVARALEARSKTIEAREAAAPQGQGQRRPPRTCQHDP